MVEDKILDYHLENECFHGDNYKNGIYIGGRPESRKALYCEYPAGPAESQYYTIGSPAIILMKTTVI